MVIEQYKIIKLVGGQFRVNDFLTRRIVGRDLYEGIGSEGLQENYFVGDQAHVRIGRLGAGQ